MLKTMGRIFIRGLFYVLPLFVTVVVFVWLAITLESLFNSILVALLGPRFDIPGIGLAAAVLLIFIVGLIIPIGPVGRLLLWLDARMQRIPGINSVYGAIRDLIEFARQAKGGQLGQVVSVPVPGTDWRALGFLTRDDFGELPEGLADEEQVAVYFPLGYQIGGMTFFLPRSQVRRVDMPPQDAFRFALTAAMITPKQFEQSISRRGQGPHGPRGPRRSPHIPPITPPKGPPTVP